MDSTRATRASGPGRTITRSIAEDARAFRVARRHTWLVRALKFLAPALAIAIVAGYGVLLRANFALNIGNFGVEKVIVTDDDLKMKNPSYFGTTAEGGKYTVRAREAVVGLKQTEPIKLAGIDGELTQPDGTTAVLRATRGLFDNNRGELELLDAVTIDTSNGMRARMRQAKVFTKENRIVSVGRVEAATATGTITARQMDLFTKARRGTFAGDVNLRLLPGTNADGTKPGFATGRDQSQPVDIKSETLVVDDASKTAIFSPAVRAVQGDTTMQAAELRVTYEGKVDPAALAAPLKPAAASAQPDPDTSRLSKIAARGGVVITAAPDRQVTADAADFDVKADTALLTGAVVVQQGRNMLRGTRLALDRRVGKSRLDAPATPGRGAGRIAATFVQAAAPPKPVTARSGAPKSAVAPESAGPFGSFKADPNAPMKIDAETLDLDDQVRQAVFRGSVTARQGDFIVQAAEIVANYTGSAGLSAVPDTSAAKAGAELTRVEAHQNVIITSKDGQSAKGDTAVFDHKSNIVTLVGKPVIVAQDKNVIECAKLVMDLNTGQSNCIADTGPKVSSITQQPSSAPAGVPSIVRVPVPSTDGRMKAIFYPQQLNDAAKQKRVPSTSTGAAKPPGRPIVDGWDSSTNPAPTQRPTP